jgi:hypothetical protein
MSPVRAAILGAVVALALAILTARQRWQAKPPVDAQRPLFLSFADLANALLTTAVDTWGRSWTPSGANAAVGPVRRPAMDLPGPAKPSEKRKVGGSTSPLTTSFAV